MRHVERNGPEERDQEETAENQGREADGEGGKEEALSAAGPGR
jgi:hypothetical protein